LGSIGATLAEENSERENPTGTAEDDGFAWPHLDVAVGPVQTVVLTRLAAISQI
jgi:hypothetical protein